MKSYISFVIFVSLFASLFMACVNEDNRKVLPPVSFVQRTLGDGTAEPVFMVEGNVKATQEIGGNASLRFEYCNGFGRKARIAVTCAGNMVTGSVHVALNEGSDTASVSIPLYGIPTSMGALEVGVSVLPEETAPLNTKTSIMVGDPVEGYVLDFDQTTSEGDIFDNVEGSTLLRIPYIKGYGRNVSVEVTSNVGLSGKKVVKLNGDYAGLSEGEPGVIEVPINGIPDVNGEVELTISISSAGGMVTKGKTMIQILENTDVFPDLELMPDIKMIGTLYKNALIGVLADAKLTVPYKNGYGRNIKVKMDEMDGISIDETLLKLRAGAVEGTFELQLQGAPLFIGEKELTIKVTTEEGNEQTQIVAVEAKYPKELLLTNILVKEVFYENAPLSKEAALVVSYENGFKRSVTCSAVFDSKASGITCNGLSTPVELEENSGTLIIPLSGTNPIKGSYPLMLVIEPEGENMQTIATAINVLTASVSFDFAGNTFEGTPIILDKSVSTKLLIPYDNGKGTTVKVEVTGMLKGSIESITLGEAIGFLEVPLSGIPTIEFGNLDIVVTQLTDGRKWQSQIPFFAGQEIVYNGLNYYPVFLDLNGNGVLESGEIWLDRNIGAISNVPGTYGALNANMDCVGYYYQWGKGYEDYCPITDGDGSNTPDDKWSIPNREWNDVCPEGYRLPTVLEYRQLCDRIVATTFRDYPNVTWSVMNSGKKTADFLTSFLKIPLGGWNNSLTGHNPQGTMGAYWTSERDAKTGNPIAMVIFNADKVNMVPYPAGARAQVRCVRK